MKMFHWQRIPLDFLQGDKFKDAADNYIRPLLTKVFVLWLFNMCLGYLFSTGRWISNSFFFN